MHSGADVLGVSVAEQWAASRARIPFYVGGVASVPVYLNHAPPSILNNRRSEVVKRLLADTCELC